jgi:cellulose synthase/poly-beta-1,6-N-acetylglucosamine synthase-like glycosyltransferase
MIAEIVLLACGSLVVYTWIFYPAFVCGLYQRHVSRQPRRAPCRDPEAALPSVTILFSAHNEEKVIGERLENLLSLSYPRDRTTIFVGVDGCDDQTERIVREFAGAHGNIRVFVATRRRGKIGMLKDMVEQAAGEILVFTDANTMFAPEAVRIMTAHFADPCVGGVCGRLVLKSVAGGQTAESNYWTWESLLKERESRMASCLGANGAIYAIRRQLFWRDIPPNTIIDDFVVGLKVCEQGYRLVYEPEAIALEDLPATLEDEWHRRVRIGAGDFQALWLCRRCLLPRQGKLAFFLLSHKVLRWFTPHLLLVALGTSLYLVGRELWGAAAPRPAAFGGLLGVLGLVVAVAFAGLALIGRALRRSDSRLGASLHFFDYFMTMQAALFCGFLRFCRGNLSGVWRRTRRA